MPNVNSAPAITASANTQAAYGTPSFPDISILGLLPGLTAARDNAVLIGAALAQGGAAGISKVNGSFCFNTGAARGTITQNRLVICDGALWHQATNLANTF